MTAGRMPTESGHIRWPADLATDEYDGWYMGRGRSVKRAVKAAIEGDLETIRACVEAEPELVDCNIRYREPLYFAVGNDHLDIARFLDREKGRRSPTSRGTALTSGPSSGRKTAASTRWRSC